MWFKPFTEFFEVELLEARQTTLSAHYIHDVTQIVDVLTEGNEALNQQNLEVLKHRRLWPSDQSNVVQGQFEWGILEGESSSGGVGKDETEVDVN